MTYKLDYLELPSADGKASRAFFEAAFGWSFTGYGPDYNAIDDAGLDVGIDSGFNRIAAPMPVIRTDHLDKAERNVAAAGGLIIRPAYDFPGGRRFHFREPGGVELAVYVEVK